MRKHVIDAIKAAKVTREPWPHLCVDNVFPATFYDQLLSALPPLSAMRQLGAGTPNRYLYWLELKGERYDVAPFWRQLRDDLFDDLWMTLEDKLAVVGETIGGELLFDLPGYSLGPHTDTPDKLITGLFYLPRDATGAKEGTILFSHDMPDPRGKGHKWTTDYKVAKVVPYAPNTALFFVRTDLSYHGVARTPRERWLLAFDVFNG